MAQQTNLNVSPYFDDFDPNDNYQKVLFKPGYPVQARELTGLQSILQNQIEKFGQHFFKEGAKVIPGNTAYSSEYFAVELNNSHLGVPVEYYIDQLIDRKIIGATTGVTAIIKQILKSENSENGNLTLYISYMSSGVEDSTIKVFADATCSSRTRAFLMGGSGPSAQKKEISTNVFASLGNATDFGDLSDLNYGNSGISDATRGIRFGGEGPSSSAGINLMEYFTMASTGTVQDFGDLNRLTISAFSAMDSNRGLIMGGRSASPVAALHSTIDYITIQTTGTVTNFGDLSTPVAESGISGSICNATRGFTVGGYNTPTSPSTSYNIIQYVTTQTLGNSQDFGDTITTRGGASICSSPTRGVTGNGFNPSLTNTIEYFELMTLGNSVDFGTSTQARRTVGGASNGHGGL